MTLQEECVSLNSDGSCRAYGIGGRCPFKNDKDRKFYCRIYQPIYRED